MLHNYLALAPMNICALWKHAAASASFHAGVFKEGVLQFEARTHFSSIAHIFNG